MYPDSYLGPIYLWQKIGGDFGKHRKIFWTIYTAVTFTMAECYFLPDALIVIPSLTGNFKALMEHLAIVIIILLVTLKVVACMVYRDKLKCLIDALENPNFRYENCDGYKPGERAASSSFKLGVWAKAMTVCYLGANFTRHSLSLVVLLKIGGHINGACQKYLTFYTHTPFPTGTFFGCGFGLLFQMMVSFIFCQQLVALEATFIGIVLYIRIHFFNLEGAVRTCRLRCLRRLKLPDDYAIFRDEDDTSLEKELNGEWRKMSSHIQMLLNAADDLEQILNVPVLVMILFVVPINTLCLYSLKTLSFDDPFLYMQLQVAASMLVLIAPYCYLGEEFTSKCFDLRNCIFETAWLSNTKSAKSTILIHLTRLQRPAALSLGKFVPISMNTFFQVVKGSYSYFTLLSEVDI